LQSLLRIIKFKTDILVRARYISFCLAIEGKLHELGIAQSIVEIAEKNAREQGAKCVLEVTVEVGVLSGVMVESLEFCFDACCRETLLEGCRLQIVQVPARAKCRNCSQEYNLKNFFDNCPACDCAAGDILSGEELRVKEMEID